MDSPQQPLITDAGPYLCIQKLRNSLRQGGIVQIELAIDETEAVLKGLLDRITRLEATGAANSLRDPSSSQSAQEIEHSTAAPTNTLLDECREAIAPRPKDYWLPLTREHVEKWRHWYCFSYQNGIFNKGTFDRLCNMALNSLPDGAAAPK